MAERRRLFGRVLTRAESGVGVVTVEGGRITAPNECATRVARLTGRT